MLQLEAADYGVPLVFFQGGYGHFEVPRSPATAADTSATLTGRSAGRAAWQPADSQFEGPWFDELARVTGMDAGDLRRYAKSTEGLVDDVCVGNYVRVVPR